MINILCVVNALINAAARVAAVKKARRVVELELRGRWSGVDVEVKVALGLG